MNQNANGLFKPYVIYTYSNDDFKRGYDLIIDRHPDVEFYYEENPSKLDFYYFLLKNAGQVVCR